MITESWLACKQCGGGQFTAEAVEYGIKLACWNCPSFIGIRMVDWPPAASRPGWRSLVSRRRALRRGADNREQVLYYKT